MVFDPETVSGYGFDQGVVLISTFSGPVEAVTARDTLRATLDDLAREVRELFRSQNGVVDGEQVARIYARAGLRNDMGWQQERPIRVKGAELVWELPDGAHVDDAENLLVSLGAIAVVAHVTVPGGEEWRAAPAPFPIPGGLLDEGFDLDEAEDDDAFPTQTIPKRTLH
jgi:hypothetical protein